MSSITQILKNATSLKKKMNKDAGGWQENTQRPSLESLCAWRKELERAQYSVQTFESKLQQKEQTIKDYVGTCFTKFSKTFLTKETLPLQFRVELEYDREKYHPQIQLVEGKSQFKTSGQKYLPEHLKPLANFGKDFPVPVMVFMYELGEDV